jgi:hypothetical protein
VLLTSTRRHVDPEVHPGRPTAAADRGMYVLWAALVAGSAVLAWDYSLASRAPKGSLTHFHLFWVGVFLFLVPAAWKLISPRTRDLDRYLILIALGLYSYFPKFLAYPGGPAYFDEYAHWTQVERIMTDGLLFMKNNQVVVIGDYPAMHTATASICHLTGLSTYHASVVLLLTLHVLTLIGIFSIATRIADSRHVGGIAALFYAVGPGFWFFNTQFAYEAFAIVLFIWSCVALVHLVRAPATSWNRTAWLVTALWISFTLVASHHLSSYANLIVLGAFTGAAVIRWLLRREHRHNVAELLVLFCTVLALTGWWFVTQAPNTKAYLEPYLKGGVTEVAGFVEKPSDGNAAKADATQGTRELFKGSTIPVYEQLLGFAATGLILLLVGFGFLAQWRRGMKGSLAWGMVGVAAVYFLAYPLILSATGASGARRSWSFTNVGVATVIAIGLASIPMLRQWWLRVPGNALLIGAVVVLMIGNVSANMNEVYRFPGVYVYGSDTRSATEEIRSAAEWLRTTQGPNQPLIGDRGAQVAFASTGKAILGVPSSGYPLWDFIISPTPPSASLLEQTRADDLRFVVVDKHQTTAVPKIGFFLDQTEPLAQQRTQPLPAATLTKWDRMPYAMRVYASDTLDIYRLDQSAYDLAKAPRNTSTIPGEAAAATVTP